ncbi:uncharacterized N-acetyltransferase p20 [Medicago truncatula]|uniref:Acetyltransferase (GNAT) domain protein n=1 Tax=Medicago truncatula TaxID=3880 RepID=G7K3P7_MEDTR|nr:uncharacterized N-acetyltransferase p20 [Medicago truncatula]AES93700.1 acetyltransferase (GNAT) domain protein [Medicago truncatula]
MEQNIMIERLSISSKEEIIDLNQITLRSFNLSDLDDLMVWHTDEKVAKFWGEPYTSKDQGINFIKNMAGKYLRCKAICHNDHAIGCIKLSSSSLYDKSRNRCAEIGYVLASKYWGKGIATCAVKQMVKVAFSEFQSLERLQALVDMDNVGSQKVLEKVGFQKEGLLRKYVFFKGKSRDMIMFSLLFTDLQL